MHLTGGTRDAGASFPLAAVDDLGERRQANRAVGFSAAGLALTGFIELALALFSGSVFICHVGWEVSGDVAHRLLDGVDPQIVTTAESAAATVPEIRHAHARARWTGRTLRVEVEGWVDQGTTVSEADELGRRLSQLLAQELPDMRSFTWSARGL